MSYLRTEIDFLDIFQISDITKFQNILLKHYHAALLKEISGEKVDR